MWEFKFYSRGGQGAVTAAKILINAAILEGKFGQAIPSYGQERKGAPVYTYARIADGPIEVKSYVGPTVSSALTRALPISALTLPRGYVPAERWWSTPTTPATPAPRLPM